MRHTFLMLLTLLTFSSYAQKIVRNERDKFTGSYIKETSSIDIRSKFSEALAFRLRKVDDIYQIEAFVSSMSAFRIDENDEMYLLFSDSISIPIKCLRGGVADFQNIGNVCVWELKVAYLLPDNVLAKLTSIPITDVRIGLGSKYILFERINSKHSTKLIEAAKIISD